MPQFVLLSNGEWLNAIHDTFLILFLEFAMIALVYVIMLSTIMKSVAFNAAKGLCRYQPGRKYK